MAYDSICLKGKTYWLHATYPPTNDGYLQALNEAKKHRKRNKRIKWWIAKTSWGGGGWYFPSEHWVLYLYGYYRR